MIVKGFKTLEQLEEKLRAVPEEKRKVIVLVGRHPNEGTTNIAVRHHKSWERLGAIAVQIPGHWTPHGLWYGIRKFQDAGRDDKSALSELLDQIPSDPQLVEFLAKKFDAPIVNFHGTGGQERKSLGVGEYRTKTGPNWIPDAAKILEKHFYPLTVPSSATHPNEVIVEHIFSGKPSSAKRKTGIRVPDPFLMWIPSDLSRSYLYHEAIDRKALEHFSKQYAPDFERFLSQLARRGKPLSRREKITLWSSEKFQALVHFARTGFKKR